MAALRDYGTKQVLYTLPQGEDSESAVFSESGAMNVMYFLDKPSGGAELVTPPLDGTILPGVTRDSILSLSRSWGEFDVVERPVTIADIKKVGYISWMSQAAVLSS